MDLGSRLGFLLILLSLILQPPGRTTMNADGLLPWSGSAFAPVQRVRAILPTGGLTLAYLTARHILSRDRRRGILASHRDFSPLPPTLPVLSIAGRRATPSPSAPPLRC